MLLKRLRAVLVLGILGVAVVTAPTAAVADAGSFCGHGNTSHWHGLTYNAVSFEGQRTFYNGNTLEHTHTYDNAYVSTFGQNWNESEVNWCGLH